MSGYQHWRVEYDEQQLVWAFIDCKKKKVNALNVAVLDELADIIHGVSQDKILKGLIIASDKADSFIVGADIEQFTQLKTVEAGQAILEKGHAVFHALAQLSIPTVAMINGFCLGGGLELALACRYRITLDTPALRLGLPEVKLGIHPGWGGMVRLPTLIGGLKALSLIMSGRLLSAHQAKKMGIIDDVVPLRQFHAAARYFIEKQPKKKSAWLACLSNTYVFRLGLAYVMQRRLKQKIRADHYPAPFAALQLWKKQGVGQAAYAAEIASVAQLFLTPTAKQLVRVYCLQNQLKSLSADKTFAAAQVHVIGAGIMGGDIAAWCALKGMRVTLQDTDPARIAPAIARAQTLFQKKLKQAHLVQAVSDALTPDVSGLGVGQADVIIEAIYEDLPAKQAIFKQVEAQAKSTALLATNTSSIPLESIAAALKQPKRLMGVHFFNPVAQMQLVEIITTEQSTKASLARAVKWVKQLGKLPLPVKSCPGFLVNRILMPYLMESVQLLEEGVDKTGIDAAAKAFGMPMGPIRLADTVGLDICLSVGKHLAEVSGQAVPQILINKVEAGQLGKKTSQGFYAYGQRKTTSQASQAFTADTQDRLIYCLLNECGACLREGVVESADLLDAGLIFGTGFAPFRGGPMHYVESLGGKAVVREKLLQLQKSYGDRFTPDGYWEG